MTNKFFIPLLEFLCGVVQRVCNTMNSVGIFDLSLEVVSVGDVGGRCCFRFTQDIQKFDAHCPLFKVSLSSLCMYSNWSISCQWSNKKLPLSSLKKKTVSVVTKFLR